ncbi:MAG: sensor histidine kinase [Myxococcota bacterium]
MRAPRPSPDAGSGIGLRWLIRTRYAAAGAEVAALLLARFVFGFALPLAPLLGLVAIALATNAALSWRWRDADPPEVWLGGALLLDTAVLTALLQLSGGAANPFSALYLVYVALAAVLLRPRWAWALVAASVLAYGALFIDPVEVPELSGHGAGNHAAHGQHAAHHDHAGYSMHLYGMFVAFATAATLIAYFVTRIASALEARDRQLARARERMARSERLASLTTLAAGSAHELGSPLATIAVVAKELEREAAELPEGSPIGDDARTIRAEVDRCRAILDRMAARAGDAAGESPRPIRLGDLVRGTLGRLGSGASERVRVDLAGDAETVVVPCGAVSQALRNVLANALEASPAGVPAELTARADAEHAVLIVRDRGPGMDAETRARATEPFFTTKETGRGMGLGLFLAQTVIDRVGGSLAIESAPGRGTTVRIELPREVR